MAESRLFNVETRFHLETVLQEDEVVTAVSGSSTDFFFGTNVGRLYHLRMEGDDAVLVKEILLVQKPHPIVNILPASAFDLLIVQCGHCLLYMDLESFALRSRSSTNQASCVALNVDPDLDDPFILSFAIGTMNKQIHVCERKNESSNVVIKLSLASPAETICYSKNSICFATKTEYFVHDLISGTTNPLFPYESGVVRPLVIFVDRDEFILSGMQGLAVFATSAGASSRPPLFCGVKKIMSFVFHQPFIHILSDDSLIVFSANDQKIKQTIQCDKSEFMCNIDGKIFICGRRGKFYELIPIQWMDQAEELLAENDVKGCLQLAEHHVELSEYDSKELMKLNFLQQKSAFIKLFAGEWDEAKKLLVESKTNPFEVINLFKELRFGNLEKSSIHNRTEDLVFADSMSQLMEYLLEIRCLEWASYAETTVDKSLVKLFVLSGKYEAIGEIESKHWNDEETRSWLLNTENFALAADLMISAGDYGRAFEIWRRLGTGELRDRRFDPRDAVQALKLLTNVSVVEEALKWLCRLNSNAVVAVIDQLKVKLDFEFVYDLLKHSRSDLIEFIGRQMVDNRDPKVYRKYLEVLIDEVKITDSRKAIRKLRRAIFDVEDIDWAELRRTLARDDRFTVEVILVEAKLKHPEKALDKLLKLDVDGQEAAELLCSRMNSEHPELFKKLLSYYLKKDPLNEQVRQRILSLLQGLGGGSEMEEVLKNVPGSWNFSDLSAFMLRSTARVTEDAMCAKMRRDLTKATLHQLKSCDKLRGNCDFILVNEKTTCSFCGGPIGDEVIVRHPQTNAIFHQACDNS